MYITKELIQTTLIAASFGISIPVCFFWILKSLVSLITDKKYLVILKFKDHSVCNIVVKAFFDDEAITKALTKYCSEHLQPKYRKITNLASIEVTKLSLLPSYQD